MTGRKFSLIVLSGLLALAGGFAVSSARAAGSCTATYCDSNIATTTTLSASSGNETPYVLYLAPSVDTMSVTWYGTSARSPVFTLNQTSPLPATTLVSQKTVTSFQQTGLSANTTYCYTLTTKYNDNTSSSTNACAATLSIANQTPSNLNVYSRGQTALFLNWKDNSTSTDPSRYFEIQRIQVTPALPTAPDVLKNPSQGIDVDFTVQTGNTPFYTILKSSTTTSAGITPSTSTWNDPSVWTTVFSGTSTNYLTPSAGPTSEQISLTDKGPFAPGLSYYYGIQNCSFIGIDWLRSDGLGAPDSVCTDPIVAGNIASPVSYGGSNVFVAVSNALRSIFSSVGSAFNRIADMMNGTAEAQSTGGPVAINDYFTNAGTSTKLTAAPSYTDTNLAPGTVYAYRVELCYQGGPHGGSYCTGGTGSNGWSNYAGARTATPDMTTQESTGLCIDNNVCIATSTTQTGWGSSGQCLKNSDCANVGRSSKIFQEN